MGFFRRVRNIVSANLDEVLTRCEDPELLLNQALRDMEETLRAALSGAARVLAQERLLVRQRDQAQTQAVAARREAEAAVPLGNDDAVRQALRRQRDQQELAETLAAGVAEAGAASRKLRRQVDATRLRLDEARRQRELLIARRRSAQARRQLLAVLSDLPSDRTGFHEFERLARQVDQMEAETDALADLSGLTHLEPPAEHETDAWVERELQRLKDPG